MPPPPYDKYMIRIDGTQKLIGLFPKIKVYMNEGDVAGLIDANPSFPRDRIFITKDGDRLPLPLHKPKKPVKLPTELKFIHTPGHSPGSQCVLINGSRLLSGDTLFIGSCGRVDMADSNRNDMKHSLNVKLASLSDDIVVYPGHDYGGDLTTIGEEKRTGVLDGHFN
jgi:glyoxylase-like metal-dependent hydrolase (beta-lactamase superfamily II)